LKASTTIGAGEMTMETASVVANSVDMRLAAAVIMLPPPLPIEELPGVLTARARSRG
jgi:hypothetical protein